MPLSPDQLTATQVFSKFILDPNTKEMGITGEPGTGKTFLIKHLIEVAKNQAKMLRHLTGDNSNIFEPSEHDIHIELTATTNPAAEVLQEKIGVSTKTIHSLIGIRPKPNYYTGKMVLVKTREYAPLHNTLIIIDEASMISKALKAMIDAAAINCKILYVFDHKQLLGIFETECIIYTEVKSQVELITPQRQDPDSPILALSKELRKTIDNGIFPKILAVGDIIQRLDGLSFKNKMVEVFSQPDFKLNTSKIVAWTNDTIHKYNRFIRRLHTQSVPFEVGEQLIANNPIISLKDTTKSVVAFKNNALVTIDSVENGIKTYEDTPIEGRVYRLKYFPDSIKVFVPINLNQVKATLDILAQQAKGALNSTDRYNTWQRFYQIKEAMCDLRPTYACTVHKSQGATLDSIFVNLTDIGANYNANEVARLLNVAISRAKNTVYLYGDLPYRYKG